MNPEHEQHKFLDDGNGGCLYCDEPPSFEEVYPPEQVFTPYARNTSRKWWRGGFWEFGRIRFDFDTSWIALPFALDLDKYSPGLHIGPFGISYHRSVK